MLADMFLDEMVIELKIMPMNSVVYAENEEGEHFKFRVRNRKLFLPDPKAYKENKDRKCVITEIFYEEDEGLHIDVKVMQMKLQSVVDEYTRYNMSGLLTIENKDEIIAIRHGEIINDDGFLDDNRHVDVEITSFYFSRDGGTNLELNVL